MAVIWEGGSPDRPLLTFHFYFLLTPPPELQRVWFVGGGRARFSEGIDQEIPVPVDAALWLVPAVAVVTALFRPFFHEP